MSVEIGKTELPPKQLAHGIKTLLKSTTRGCIQFRSKTDLLQRPEMRTLALERHHRTLILDTFSIEDAIVAKRSELEESLLRIKELHADISHREAVLANPAPRREALQDAAHELYLQLAADKSAEAASSATYDEQLDDYDFDLGIVSAGVDGVDGVDGQKGRPPSATVSSSLQAHRSTVDAMPSEAEKALEFLRGMLPVASPATDVLRRSAVPSNSHSCRSSHRSHLP